MLSPSPGNLPRLFAPPNPQLPRPCPRGDRQRGPYRLPLFVSESHCGGGSSSSSSSSGSRGSSGSSRGSSGDVWRALAVISTLNWVMHGSDTTQVPARGLASRRTQVSFLLQSATKRKTCWTWKRVKVLCCPDEYAHHEGTDEGAPMRQSICFPPLPRLAQTQQAGPQPFAKILLAMTSSKTLWSLPQDQWKLAHPRA